MTTTKLTAAQFRALIDRTARARDSLSSCRNGEVLAETETVLRIAAMLESAQLARASVQLETERRAMLDSVARTRQVPHGQPHLTRAHSAMTRMSGYRPDDP